MTIRAVRVEGDIAYVALTLGVVSVIDAVDAEKVGKWNWCCISRADHRAMRSVGSGKNKTKVLLHRYILNAPANLLVDHIDGDPLNNRRANLRLVTHQQNMCNRKMDKRNTSGAKGVSRIKSTNRWQASIGVHGVNVRIGEYESIADATAAYEAASIRYHGEYRRRSPVSTLSASASSG